MNRPSFPRRFWRTLTGRRTGAETCRPVTVLGDSGQPVHTMVLGAEPMSEEGQAAFGEIVRAAQRKHREELRAARQAADDDVRAVAALLGWIAIDRKRAVLELSDSTERALSRVTVVFGDRIDALDAKAGG